ncbi:UDP-glucuronosyltransferase 2C1-like [Dendronephthya gigantea]|uniref:UDP-glucuronosyltransferase 2C1-like n=1 Tax=Dendronephthya gigantea TaxID=151771 RepID=UPI00106AE9D5|nr:UDP-glucuronosyltransferase 2C1-like [Dendronephthya gigantea]
MERTNTLPFLIIYLILLCLFLVKQAQCGHIVGFASMNYVSHHRMLWKLGKELQTRGHKYTHILPNFAKETYDDVDVKMFNSSVTSKEILDWYLNLSTFGDVGKDIFALIEALTTVVPERWRFYRQFCEDLLKHERLIVDLKSSVDLVLCDVANECCYILADMLNVSRVDVSTVGFASTHGVYLFDYPQASIYITLEASLLLPKASKLSFINRLKGFLTCTGFWSFFASSKLEDLWEKHGKANSNFTRAEDARRVHGIALIPHDFALEQSRPLGANIKVIGALSPEPARRLPEYLDKFMNENRVVVIVSFGTIFSHYPSSLAQTIADELSQVRAAVLWKYSGVMPKNIGKNIKIIQWFPKNEFSFNDLLGHSSTKVFVTHGGLNGYQESVYHGVPMVVIPMMGDQYRQANLVQHKELGVAVKWKSLIANRNVLQDAISKVLNNKVYVENTKRLSTIIKDRKQSPSQEGADWIEYALHHDGAPHLISEAIDLPQYKLHMFDVCIFLTLVACLLVYSLLRLCYCLLGACGRRMQVKEKQT